MCYRHILINEPQTAVLHKHERVKSWLHRTRSRRVEGSWSLIFPWVLRYMPLTFEMTCNEFIVLTILIVIKGRSKGELEAKIYWFRLHHHSGTYILAWFLLALLVYNPSERERRSDERGARSPAIISMVGSWMFIYNYTNKLCNFMSRSALEIFVKFLKKIWG